MYQTVLISKKLNTQLQYSKFPTTVFTQFHSYSIKPPCTLKNITKPIRVRHCFTRLPREDELGLSTECND